MKGKIMDLNELKQKPLWQMTGEEFLYLQENCIGNSINQPTFTIAHDRTEKRHVYGIADIAKLFGCSMPTAHRIKKSGKTQKKNSQKSNPK